jgi:phage shock protein PspC (stress-responsive transcriptional regulator)
MSALREAVVLPAIFLSVVLIGAVRPGAAIAVVPPSLAALVAAMVLFTLLVRSGALDPNQLLHAARPPLANLNGAAVLLTGFAASAQVVTMLVPESGVPALITWAVLVSLLAQALALGPDRARLLRGLAVTFGAAFILKFIILATISAPAQSRFARALQLLFEGVTLGGVTQRPPHAAEGYLAFVALILYLVGVAFLPSASWHMVRATRRELPD